MLVPLFNHVTSYQIIDLVSIVNKTSKILKNDSLFPSCATEQKTPMPVFDNFFLKMI